MIKKLLLIFSFIVLATIAFNGTTYAAQTGKIIVITEEISKLNKLYKEGVITEEEFSKAKSILLNPDSGTTKEELSTLNKLYKEGFITEEEFSKAKSILLNPDSGTTKKKKKAVIFKKQKLTAAERRQLENELIEAEKALKEQLRAEKRAERERIKQASLDEKKRITEEREKACADDPKSKGCKTAKLQLTKILEKIKIKSSATSIKEKKERELEKQASLEEQKRNKAEKAAAKRAEVAAKKAEKKRLKAERKKACSEDPESKACKEGKRKKFLIF